MDVISSNYVIMKYFLDQVRAPDDCRYYLTITDILDRDEIVSPMWALLRGSHGPANGGNTAPTLKILHFSDNAYFTFRVNGSNKRMRELQAAFEAPPRVRPVSSGTF